MACEMVEWIMMVQFVISVRMNEGKKLEIKCSLFLLLSKDFLIFRDVTWLECNLLSKYDPDVSSLKSLEM